MFVAAEVLLDLSFPAAEARLADLARGGLLTPVPEGAYGDGLTGLVRVCPLGAVPGMSKLVEVHFLEVVTRGESAVLALRWEATGPGGRLFPALDADMSLTPAGEHSTRLSLAGVYRPPFAALGAGWTGRFSTGWPMRRSGPCWPGGGRSCPPSGAGLPALRSRPAPCRVPA